MMKPRCKSKAFNRIDCRSNVSERRSSILMELKNPFLQPDPSSLFLALSYIM